MQLTISNFSANKTINVELPDDIMTSVEDLRFIIGTDQYELKSTKTEEDKLREKLAVEFGEETYPDLYKQYPNFGKEDCALNKDDMKSIIKAKLIEFGDKYKALLEDKKLDQLLTSLVASFSSYCSVRERMEKEDKEIKDSMLDENVFFDYIKRFKAAFESAKCLKDVHESIVKIHHYASIDNREMYGYTFIFQCLHKFFDKVQELEEELSNQKPSVKLKDHKLFTDEQYWSEQGELVASVIAELDTLEKKYGTFETLSYANVSDSENIFNCYITALEFIHSNLKKAQDELLSKMETLKDPNNPSEEDREEISKLVSDVNKQYSEMIMGIADLRVRFHLDKRQWKSEYEKQMISANFGVVDFWYQRIKNAKKEEKTATVQAMIQSLITHEKILKAASIGLIDAEKLCAGLYKDSDLKKIINELPSKDEKLTDPPTAE